MVHWESGTTMGDYGSMGVIELLWESGTTRPCMVLRK